MINLLLPTRSSLTLELVEVISYGMEIHGNKLYITPEEVIAGNVLSPHCEPRWSRACSFKHMEDAPDSGERCFVVSSGLVLDFRSDMRQVAELAEKPYDKWRVIGQVAAREMMSHYRSFYDRYHGQQSQAALAQSESDPEAGSPQYSAELG